MRYFTCGCPCQGCDSNIGPSCPPSPPVITNYFSTDSIFLVGERNGNFIVLVRRHYQLYSVSGAWPLWFTICIPMSGNIGSYHFTSDMGRDCYLMIKKYICSTKTMYYMWFSGVSTTTEPPLENVDKTNYIFIWDDVDGTKHWYIRRTFRASDLGTDEEDKFEMYRMNSDLPYVFWGQPSKVQIDLHLTGTMTFGWCDGWNGVLHTSTFDYNTFDGTYILENHVVASNIYWKDFLYDSGSVNIGQVKNCSFVILQGEVYTDVDVNARFFLQFGGVLASDFLTVEIDYNNSDNGGFPLHNASWKLPFNLDTNFWDGDGPSGTFSCVDEKLLTGDYGQCTFFQASSPSPISCSADDLYNLKCSKYSSQEPIGGTASIKVLEWQRLQCGI